MAQVNPRPAVKKDVFTLKWEKAMEGHSEYVSSLKPPPAKGRGRPAKRRFDLHQCQGSYIVKCDTVTKGWEEFDSHIFTINIFAGKKGSLTANYDFGIITGTLLISSDESILDDLVGDSDDDSNADSDEDSDEDDEEQDTKKGRKRTLAQATKAKGKENAKPGLPAKKKKIMPSLSRRVFYRLHGCETGEGEVLPEAEPGQIDFLNDNCTKFSGLAYRFPYAGSNVEFSGYKISGAPKGDAE